MSYSPWVYIQLGKCPACGGDHNYRMIVTVSNGWRSLCGDTFHASWFLRWYRRWRGTDPILQVTAAEHGKK